MKKQLGPVDRVYPMPAVLVVGGTMECADALAVAWINIMSSTPPTIAMGLRDSRRTLELIDANDSFTVNVPPASLAAEVDYCGIFSGHKVDKFAATGLTLTPSAIVEAPLIEQCPFNLECRVSERVRAGSYVIVIGEIVEAHAEEAVLADPDGTLVDMDALDPLIYIAGSREYRRLGAKVADAFSVGKSIAEKNPD